MEEIFARYAGYIALGLEVVAVVIIGVGAVQAVIGLLTPRSKMPASPFFRKKEVWVHFAVSLLLGLEFELGADIIRSAISPTWEQVGQLGAIALIRTFLNFFLEKDIEKYDKKASGEQQPVEGMPS